MATAPNTRTWYLLHKWSSLICTVFLLLTCLTGLPLIFTDEIEGWQQQRPGASPTPSLTPAQPELSLDHIVAIAFGRHPGQVVRWLVFDKPHDVIVTLAPSARAAPQDNHWLRFDAENGRLLDASGPQGRAPSGFMQWARQLHTDLLSGLPGELFLGVVGLLFVLAVVSGTMLYAPFMRKLDFGTVRRDRRPRLRRLDQHNLLGIATLAWAAVVGMTGAINELSTPLFALWRATEVRTMLAPYKGLPAPQSLQPVERVRDVVRQTLPDNTLFSIVYPDADIGSPHHYLAWTKGDRPLTSRLFTPLLIDARTGELTTVAQLPWYLKALELSRPLHFGDYGGLPMKLLWAGLDLLTIAVLVTGLLLWRARPRA